MRIKEIAFTAYAVSDMARARSFYEGVLGLAPNQPIEPPNVQWIEYNIGPGTLAIGSSPRWPSSPEGTSAALEVEDFDEAIAVLREHRVEFMTEPGETLMCRMAVVRDPDGNRLVIHHRKKL